MKVICPKCNSVIEGNSDDFLCKNCGKNININNNTMDSNKIVYIAGAYISRNINDIYENIQKARQYAVKYWKLGYTVVCPHMNSGLMDGVLLSNSEWIERYKKLLKRCDIIVMIPEWEFSAGATQEHALAKEKKIEIIYEKVLDK